MLPLSINNIFVINKRNPSKYRVSYKLGFQTIKLVSQKQSAKYLKIGGCAKIKQFTNLKIYDIIYVSRLFEGFIIYCNKEEEYCIINPKH